MTPQKALNKLDETVIGDFELKVVLSEALKKQAKEKPKIINPQYTRNFIFGCPNCNEFVGFNQKCCAYCGQALDWSGVDD